MVIFKRIKVMCVKTHERTLCGKWVFKEGEIYTIEYHFNKIKIIADNYLPINISKKFLETRFKKI